jgi:hypothetical protein
VSDDVASAETNQLTDLIEIAMDLFYRGQSLSKEQIQYFNSLMIRRVGIPASIGMAKLAFKIWSEKYGRSKDHYFFAFTEAITTCVETGILVGIFKREGALW